MPKIKYDFLVQMPWGDRPAVINMDKYTKKIYHLKCCQLQAYIYSLPVPAQYNILTAALSIIFKYSSWWPYLMHTAFKKLVFLFAFVTVKSINKKLIFIFSLCTTLTVPFNFNHKNNNKKKMYSNWNKSLGKTTGF